MGEIFLVVSSKIKTENGMEPCHSRMDTSFLLVVDDDFVEPPPNEMSLQLSSLHECYAVSSAAEAIVVAICNGADFHKSAMANGAAICLSSPAQRQRMQRSDHTSRGSISCTLYPST